MANYNVLKTAIQNAVDWDNNNKQISGNDLLAILLSIVNNTVSAGYLFAGVATTSTNPGTPDQNVFYIAGPGTYPNFNNTTINDGAIGVMKYNGSWTIETLLVGKNYDAQINEILGEVSVSEKLDSSDITVSLLLQNGRETAISSLHCTDLIPYSARNKYVYSGYVGNYDINAACYYNANREIIGYDATPSGLITNRELTNIPDGTAYIRFCVWTVDQRFSVVISSELSEMLDDLQQGINDLDERLTPIEQQMSDVVLSVNEISEQVTETEILDSSDITVALLLQNSRETAIASLHCTDLIPYSSRNNYYFSGGLGNYDINAAGYYNANRELIGCDNTPSGVISNRLLTNIPSGTAYIRFCVWTVDETFKVVISSNLSQRLDDMEQDIDALKQQISLEENTLSLDFTPNAISYILSPFNEQNNIKLTFKVIRNMGETRNPVFNLMNCYLVNKNTSVETLVHDCQDDICPTDFGGQYIGANHAGYGRILITANGHGKTTADIGSIWTDGTHQFTIIGISNENRIYILGENLATYPLFSFATISSSATLTHVSGATHTGNINVTARSYSQWWSGTTQAKTKVYADGKELTESGTYNFKRLMISEIYDVINPASALQVVQQNVGSFSSNPNPGQFSQADKYSRHSITYTFDGAQSCKVATDILAYQNIGDGYFGFTQQAILSGSNLKLYIPLAKSLDNGTKQVDFRTIVNDDSAVQGLIRTNDFENAQLPPDRWVEFSDLIGISVGYMFDYGVGGPNRKNALSGTAIHISNANKMYSYGIGKEMFAFDNYSAVCFRNYIDRSKINTGGVISKNVFEYRGRLYVYADFNAAGIYDVEIPGDYQGGEIVVYDKRDNVILLSQNASNAITIKVDPDSVMYGYFVGYIDKQK